MPSRNLGVGGCLACWLQARQRVGPSVMNSLPHVGQTKFTAGPGTGHVPESRSATPSPSCFFTFLGGGGGDEE